MYLRFAMPWRDARLRAAPGIFAAMHLLPPYDRTDWRCAEIRAVYDWFCDHLDTPDELYREFGKGQWRPGICWFRENATDHVSQARYLAWLMSDLGVPIEELRSPYPGARIWDDAHQIVAIPDRRSVITVH